MIEKNKTVVLIPFILVLIAIGQTAIDIYLPSMPHMAHSLNANEAIIKLTIALFLVGFAISQLIYGPLSDALGRKHVLLIGLTLFCISSFICSTTSSAPVFLSARLLQGLGVGSASVISRAIMRDVFSGKQLAKIASYASMAWAIVPIVAPVMGGYIQKFFGWRMNFVLLASIGILLMFFIIYFLAETNNSIGLNTIKPKQIINNYTTIISNPRFLANIISMMSVYCVMITFNVISPFLLQVSLHFTAIEYSWALCSTTIGFFIGSFLNSQLSKKYQQSQLVMGGYFFTLVCSAFLLLTGMTNLLNIYAIIIPMLLIYIGMGIIYPNCIAGCLICFPNMAGSASALYGFLVFAAGSTTTIFTAHIHTSSQLPLSIVIFALLLTGFSTFSFITNQKKFINAPD